MRDPIEILTKSHKGRIQHLLPLCYERMAASPLAFYRGAAAIMAYDLIKSTDSGIVVQCSGDAHLNNFGAFASPERNLIFDITDFDETHTAPFEYDLKRLATSFMILADEDLHFSYKNCRKAAKASIESYYKHMAKYAAMSPLEVWYSHIDVDQLAHRADLSKEEMKEQIRIQHGMVKLKGGKIKDDPPLIYHPISPEGKKIVVHTMEAFAAYRNSLPTDRHVLIDQYKIVDLVAKVVGVGSVGTRCGLVLLMAGDGDTLVLQIKEAGKSVLDPGDPTCAQDNQGLRIVTGQRIMQAASDIFLGFTRVDGHDYYVRQWRDMKVKPMVETFSPGILVKYAQACGWTLARAHARSGKAKQISKSHLDPLDFAENYADLNFHDYGHFLRTLDNGRLAA